MIKEKISVVVPVYNAQKYLNRCVESLLNQTYENMEIILVDDGSTDDSPKICDNFEKEHENIIVVHKPNGGVSSARNEGIKASHGKYIGYIDADDYVTADMYETLSDLIEEKKTDIAIGSFFKEQDNGDFIPYCSEKIIKVFLKEDMIANLLENKYYTCSACCMLFKRENIKDIKWNENLTHNEDLLYIYTAMKSSSSAAYTSKPMYFYCCNEGSAAHSPFNKNKMSIIDVWDMIKNDEDIKSKRLKKIISEQFIRNNLMCAMLAAESDYKDEEDYKRFRRNISSGLLKYLFSSAALGYKIYAVAMTISVKLFKKLVIKKR